MYFQLLKNEPAHAYNRMRFRGYFIRFVGEFTFIEPTSGTGSGNNYANSSFEILWMVLLLNLA